MQKYLRRLIGDVSLHVFINVKSVCRLSVVKSLRPSANIEDSKRSVIPFSSIKVILMILENFFTTKFNNYDFCGTVHSVLTDERTVNTKIWILFYYNLLNLSFG